MTKVDIHRALAGKWEDGTRPKDLYNMHISEKPTAYLDDIIKVLDSEERRVQSGCAELASLFSGDKPDLLYPHVEVLVANLEAQAPVLRWEAVCALGNLASVDKQNKTPALIGRIADFLSDKSIVLQGHSVRALAKIAGAFPETASEILEMLLSQTEYFPGNRIGFIVEAMEPFVGNPEFAPRVKKFVEPFLSSDVKSVVKKARKVMKSF
ncbi:MAG: HEAT repeat domain-containing protein [Candidatus Thorarchaeota archaeon]